MSNKIIAEFNLPNLNKNPSIYNLMWKYGQVIYNLIPKGESTYEQKVKKYKDYLNEFSVEDMENIEKFCNNCVFIEEYISNYGDYEFKNVKYTLGKDSEKIIITFKLFEDLFVDVDAYNDFVINKKDDTNRSKEIAKEFIENYRKTINKVYSHMSFHPEAFLKLYPDGGGYYDPLPKEEYRKYLKNKNYLTTL